MPRADGAGGAREAPYYAYVESYPRAPAPGTGANTEKGFSFSDLMLVVALIGVVLVGLGRILVVKGCCVCEEARPMFASSTRRRASRSGDEYGELLTAETELPVPSLMVDLLWHSHMLFPSRYASECMRIAGVLINHDDDL